MINFYIQLNYFICFLDIADMAMLNGIDTKAVAPRLFCDICDEFDIHDTEDCPTQGIENIPVYSFLSFFSYFPFYIHNIVLWGSTPMRSPQN